MQAQLLAPQIYPYLKHFHASVRCSLNRQSSAAPSNVIKAGTKNSAGGSRQSISSRALSGAQSSTCYDVIVLGLGAMGSATAYHLAKRGAKVLGLEQFSIPNDRGSSHGLSRIIRKAYFEHPSYVALLEESYKLWRELEQETGEDLLTVTGSLEISSPRGEFQVVDRSKEAADLHSLPYEILTGEQVNKRFPAYNLPSDYRAFYQPESGILAAENCVAAHATAARAHGAHLIEGVEVPGWSVPDGGHQVKVDTKDGQSFHANRLVLCSGPWIGEQVPEIARVAVPERQVVGFFAHNGGTRFLPENFPVFIIEDEGGFYYGFPEFKSEGKMKIARFGHRNEVCRPTTITRSISSEDMAITRTPLQLYFPSVSHEGAYSVCSFTNSPDGHFIFDFHPTQKEVLLCSACSGHGFKMSPVIGSIMADLALTGSTAWEISRHLLTPGRMAAQKPS